MGAQPYPEEGKDTGWIAGLIRLLRSMSGEPAGSGKTEKPDPETYAWKETEEEYQKTQAQWLARVRARKEHKSQDVE